MFRPFRPILDAATSFVSKSNQMTRGFGRGIALLERALDDAHAKVVGLVNRQLAVGLPGCKPSYPGGTKGWEFDVRQALQRLLDSANELRTAARNVPDPPSGTVVEFVGERRRRESALSDYRDLERRFRHRSGELLDLHKHADQAQDQVPEPSPAVKEQPATNDAVPVAALNRTEQAALSIIKAQPKGQGLRAKEILKKLKARGITLAESSLRRHILPKLMEHHRVVNHRAAGGYLVE